MHQLLNQIMPLAVLHACGHGYACKYVALCDDKLSFRHCGHQFTFSLQYISCEVNHAVDKIHTVYMHFIAGLHDNILT
jgi:hypothetical protein